jgi:hypothetical protein
MKNGKLISFSALALTVLAYASELFYSVRLALIIALVALVLYFIARKSNPGDVLNTITIVLLIAGFLFLLVVFAHLGGPG